MNANINPDKLLCEKHKQKICHNRQSINSSACLSISKNLITKELNTKTISVCECLPGYRFDQLKNECEDINECHENRHNCDISSGAFCQNLIGGYVCVCSLGYEGRNGICKGKLFK